MRLLIVEDEHILANNLQEYLQGFGFVVEVINDGQEAYDIILEEPYDCILLDINLPHKNGFEILTHLRTNQNTTPVLMLTARDTEQDKISGLNTGADDYVTKPFSMAEIKARIHALIRRASSQINPSIQIGDISINPLERTVTKAGRDIELTSKEFAVLELLARHCNEVITRTMIFDHVWGSDFETLSNVIDVYIRNLRKKLGKQLIKTIKGTGYKLITT